MIFIKEAVGLSFWFELSFHSLSARVWVSKHVYDVEEKVDDVRWEESKSPMTLVSTQVTMAVLAMLLALTGCVSH